MSLSKGFKRKVHKYIGESLDKGYPYNSIKKSFIIHGYNEEVAEKLIRSYKAKDRLTKVAPLALVLLLTAVFVFYSPGKSYTTLAFNEKSYNYTDTIGLTFNQNSTYTWNLQNNGLLKSVKLNGEAKMNGTARVYLKHGNDTFLIFDSKKLETQSVNQITGFVIEKQNIEFNTNGNLSEEEQTVIDSLIADLNETRNNAKINIIADGNLSEEIEGDITGSQKLLADELFNMLKNNEKNISISIQSDFSENESGTGTNQTPNPNLNDTTDLGLNDTIDLGLNDTINPTPYLNESETDSLINETTNASIGDITNATEINETATNETENISLNNIDIALDYLENSPYDEDNNGIENTDGVIDFTVEKTKFNWDANQENLCTRWNIYSIGSGESTSICYGSEKCCNFVDLSATRSNWSEAYYSAYGKDGAALKNIISAQVLYIDYNLSQSNPYTSIYYSDWKNLTAEFHERFTRFEDICIETCALPYYNDTSYELVFEVENSSLILDSIIYSLMNYENASSMPILLKNFSNISIKKYQEYKINLSEYFYDADNDNLTFGYYNASGTDETIINLTIANDTALLKSNYNTGTVYMYFTANDSAGLAVSNIFSVDIKEEEKKSQQA